MSQVCKECNFGMRCLSDQNLELIPDYEQRIAVLQELKFIDDNSTVLLKGRVACEVSFSIGSCSCPRRHS